MQAHKQQMLDLTDGLQDKCKQSQGSQGCSQVLIAASLATTPTVVCATFQNREEPTSDSQH